MTKLDDPAIRPSSARNTGPMVEPARLATLVGADRFWTEKLEAASVRHVGLHLGVFTEPYLTYILEGRKTIESRLGVTRQPPFRKVKEGDILLLKKSSGPIVALAHISDVWYYELERLGLRSIVKRFGAALCLEEEFMRAKSSAAFATLIRLDHVYRVQALKVTKRDRRGWVVLQTRIAR